MYNSYIAGLRLRAIKGLVDSALSGKIRLTMDPVQADPAHGTWHINKNFLRLIQVYLYEALGLPVPPEDKSEGGYYNVS